MYRKSVIITMNVPGCNNLKAWGNLRKLCNKKGFKYTTLVQKKLPVTIGNLSIHRVKFEE